MDPGEKAGRQKEYFTEHEKLNVDILINSMKRENFY